VKQLYFIEAEQTILSLENLNAKSEQNALLLVHNLKASSQMLGFYRISNNLHLIETLIKENEFLKLKRSVRFLKLQIGFAKRKHSPSETLAVVENVGRNIQQIAKVLKKKISFHFENETNENEDVVLKKVQKSLLHLVRNAIDHGIQQQGRIDLKIYKEQSQVIVEVKDNGRGIKAPHKSQIFKPGFSTKQTACPISGRGMGLYIVKKEVEALGGHIEVQSSQNGTSFKIAV
jgi:chemotaxis protein histidine kinase CheA